MAKATKIDSIKGWVLIAPNEDADGKRIPRSWYICWHEIFDKKNYALDFAGKSGWKDHRAGDGRPKSYRAVRAQLRPAR